MSDEKVNDEDINRLADAIVNFLSWQERRLAWKAEMRVKRMVEAQRRRAANKKGGVSPAQPCKSGL